ncbi:MAG TPA: flagellar basal body-associated FliL family protein [Acetivibrio sp.]|uniref:flagellar basal body-associated FliL family protein n=1 Tax=Acetivibrio sp. TaxID=1872092 RepID=UPI002BC3233F|nr:flagellar basal body-associated FliL family protein [Acetivibrio sp.]HOM02064.1 flagellar basal body-associated FliL family protein [Acetivibrio sp.]
MERKSSFFVLIGIVAFLSLALALLAGYIFFVQGGQDGAQKSPDKAVVTPKDKDLMKIKLFDEKTPFNLKSTDPKKISVIVVNVEVSYFAKVKKISDTTAKIEANKSKLQEIVGTYFQSLTLEDVMKSDAKERAREELTKMMNDQLLANENTNSDIVYTVVFDQWFYQ